eukprot:gene5236-937_t
MWSADPSVLLSRRQVPSPCPVVDSMVHFLLHQWLGCVLAVGSLCVEDPAIHTVPEDACSTLGNTMQGKFCLAARGRCTFVTKQVQQCEAAGALGVVITDNNQNSARLFMMSDDGHGHNVNTRAVLVSHEAGTTLWNAVAECSMPVEKALPPLPPLSSWNVSIPSFRPSVHLNYCQVVITLGFPQDYYFYTT